MKKYSLSSMKPLQFVCQIVIIKSAYIVLFRAVNKL